MMIIIMMLLVMFMTMTTTTTMTKTTNITNDNSDDNVAIFGMIATMRTSQVLEGILVSTIWFIYCVLKQFSICGTISSLQVFYFISVSPLSSRREGEDKL